MLPQLVRGTEGGLRTKTNKKNNQLEEETTTEMLMMLVDDYENEYSFNLCKSSTHK